MLSKKSEYAINILTELARREQGIFYSSREIATQNDIPSTLVPQVVSRLQKSGLIKSSRGSTGGICLAVNPEEISIKQVIEIIDGKIGISRCLKDEKYCLKAKNCPLREIWKRAQGKMLKDLEETSIKDVASKCQKK